jgi:hypothetical protein
MAKTVQDVVNDYKNSLKIAADYEYIVVVQMASAHSTDTKTYKHVTNLQLGEKPEIRLQFVDLTKLSFTYINETGKHEITLLGNILETSKKSSN